jgi:hypothetical protein
MMGLSLRELCLPSFALFLMAHQTPVSADQAGAAATVECATTKVADKEVGGGYKRLASRRTGTLILDRPERLCTDKNVSAVAYQGSYSIDYESLEEILNTSIGGGGQYGVIDGSAKASYLKREKTESWAIYLILTVEARSNSIEMLVKNARTVFRKDLKRRNDGDLNSNQFYAKYGDSYVSRAIYGGGAQFIAKLTSGSQSRYEKISADLEINGPSGSGKGSFDKAVTFVKKHGKAQFSAFQLGTDATLPIEIDSTKPGTGQEMNVDKIVKYAAGLQKKISPLTAILISVEQRPFNEIQNVDAAISAPIQDDIYDALILQNSLKDLRSDAFSFRAIWNDFIKAPETYQVPVDKRAALLMKARKNENALGLIAQDIDKQLHGLELQPFLRENYEALGALQNRVKANASVPMEVKRMVPTIVSLGDQIKRDPASGAGLAPNRNRTYAVNVVNLKCNWMPGRCGGSTGRLEYTSLSIDFLEKPEGLTLEYMAELESERRGIKPINQLNREATGWLPAGSKIGNNVKGRIWGIAFRLGGPLKDKYFLEYQVHQGNKFGDSEIAGNSPQSVSQPETMVGGRWAIEGVRLAIWPKPTVAQNP